MSLADLLTLQNTVQVARETRTADGYGGATVSTTLTTLSRAVIWAAGASDSFISDKVAKASTHVLVLEPSEYSWSVDDKHVTYGGSTFKVVGTPDNVLNYDEIEVVSLERLI